jgi:adenosylcobinamide-phosphate synthase
MIVVAGGAAAVAVVVQAVAGRGWGSVLVIVLATTGLAQRSLDDHVRAVARPLVRGDLPAARHAVSMIVGRDTGELDEAGVATAAVESLAESFCDGVVLPAFSFLVAGLPGLAAAKAINTADSMIGHRTSRLAAFGWAAARADDVAAWLPARIAGVLICVAGRSGWRTMVRDAPAHASPNGGWPEAAMAGVLGRRLGGAVTYDGEPAHRAVLGTGAPPDAADLHRALRIYRAACLLLWLGVGALAWAR